jgi:hypothetical protein
VIVDLRLLINWRLRIGDCRLAAGLTIDVPRLSAAADSGAAFDRANQQSQINQSTTNQESPITNH